ncbi:hypothetical protein GCM10010417_33060 [Streptomyces carpaticus]
MHVRDIPLVGIPDDGVTGTADALAHVPAHFAQADETQFHQDSFIVLNASRRAYARTPALTCGVGRSHGRCACSGRSGAAPAALRVSPTAAPAYCDPARDDPRAPAEPIAPRVSPTAAPA